MGEIGQCNRVGFIIIPQPYDGGAEPICDICDAQYVWNADNLLIHPSSPVDTLEESTILYRRIADKFGARE